MNKQCFRVMQRAGWLGLAMLCLVSQAAIAQVTKTMNLSVDGGNLVLGPSQCVASGVGNPQRGPGCLRFLPGEAGHIVFRLTGATGCAPGAQWQLDEIMLAEKRGHGPKPNKPNAAQWANMNKNLDNVVTGDFDVDPNTGIVTATALGAGLRMANRNLQGVKGEPSYSIFYRVRATCNGNSIYSDPMIENEG